MEIEVSQDVDSMELQVWKHTYNNVVVRGFADVFPTDKVLPIKRLVEESKQTTKTLIYDAILTLVRSFNLGIPMSAPQIIDTVQDICELYPFFTIRDIKFFCTKASRGDFGLLKHSIDKSTILEWMHKYQVSRAEFIENDHNLKKQAVNNVYEFITDQKILDVLKSTTKAFEEKNKKPASSKPVDPSPEKVWANSVFSEFDALFKKQVENHKIKGTKIVEYKGKKVDINEFLELKLKERSEA